MRESSFQFKDPYISELNFKENEEFDIENFESLKMNFDISIKKSDSEPKALVTLKMQLGDEENCPFQLLVQIGAFFYWNSEFDNELVDDCLNKNAPALLISYVRPIIANVTSVSKYPAFNLPFIDLFAEENE